MVESLVLDLLEWLGTDARPYSEVLDAWRTSCPRLPVWEETTGRGFVTSRVEPGHGPVVSVSAAGRAYLRRHRGAGEARHSRRSGEPAAAS